MSEKEEIKPQYIYYSKHKIKLFLPFPIRKGICVACKRSVKSGEIKTTQMHHTVYAYEVKTVYKNPALALNNSLEFCFGDHKIADGLRDVLLSNPRGGLRSLSRVIQVVKLLPEDQQKHFTRLCHLWLKEKRNGR